MKATKVNKIHNTAGSTTQLNKRHANVCTSTKQLTAVAEGGTIPQRSAKLLAL